MTWPLAWRYRLDATETRAKRHAAEADDLRADRDTLRIANVQALGDIAQITTTCAQWKQEADQRLARIQELRASQQSTLERLGEATERYDKLVDKMLAMKQQGFMTVPPKIAPQAGTAEDGYMKRELAAQKGPDPFIEGLMAEGKTLEEALAIRKQAQQDFKAGEM